MIEPGVIEVANANSRITIGEPDGSLSPRAEAIAAALRAGGMGSEAVPDIRTRLWVKLMTNISSGPMAVLTQSLGSAVVQEEACCDAIRRIGAETTAIANAMGCPAKADPEAQIANLRKLNHTSSIVQDLQLGPPHGDRCNVRRPVGAGAPGGAWRTPTLDLLVALAKLRARSAGLY